MDRLIFAYNDDAFQTAFRAYFDELGCQVSNWNELFAEMNHAAEPTYIRQDETGRVIAFIMFAAMDVKSWFFRCKAGFIREIWVAPEQRRQGIGSELLGNAEAWMRHSGIRRCLLTTDTAAEFYKRYGYHWDESITAKNNAPVFIKEW